MTEFLAGRDKYLTMIDAGDEQRLHKETNQSGEDDCVLQWPAQRLVNTCSHCWSLAATLTVRSKPTLLGLRNVIQGTYKPPRRAGLGEWYPKPTHKQRVPLTTTYRSCISVQKISLRFRTVWTCTYVEVVIRLDRTGTP